jgi:hypothetical protein
MMYGGGKEEIHTFITSALNGDEWSTSNCNSPSAGRKFPYPSKRQLAGTQSRHGLCVWENISRPDGTRTPVGQLVACHFIVNKLSWLRAANRRSFKLTTVQITNISMQLASLSMAWSLSWVTHWSMQILDFMSKPEEVKIFIPFVFEIDSLQ